MPTNNTRKTQIILAIIAALSAIIVALFQAWPNMIGGNKTPASNTADEICNEAKNTIETGSGSVVINCASARGDINVNQK